MVRSMLILILVKTAVIISSSSHIKKRNTNNGENSAKKIVCYYTNLSVYRADNAKFTPLDIEPHLCTHLMYAFGTFDLSQNALRPLDTHQDIEQGGYAEFTGLKEQNENLKTLLSIGGWKEGSANFSVLAGNEEKRSAFVRQTVRFLRQNNFDGLDIDWQYPTFRQGGQPEDKQNYASLIQELREAFDREATRSGRPRLLLSMVVPFNFDYIMKGYDLQKINKYIDFLNIAAYDYHSTNDGYVGHHAPLYSLQSISNNDVDAKLNIDATVQYYTENGVDSKKLIIGIPTYGRTYTLVDSEDTKLGSLTDRPGVPGPTTKEAGFLSYYEICSSLKKDGDWSVVHINRSIVGPYAYRDDQWISYDDESSAGLKGKYAREKGLGGIMFWTVDNDDFRGECHSGTKYPIINAGKFGLFYMDETTDASEILTDRTDERDERRRSNQASELKPHFSATTSTPTGEFLCKELGIFADPNDCANYFLCLNPEKQNATAEHMTCPPGLLFSKQMRSCDFSQNVVCSKKSSRTTSSNFPSTPPQTTSKFTSTATPTRRSPTTTTLKTTATTFTTKPTIPQPPTTKPEISSVTRRSVSPTSFTQISADKEEIRNVKSAVIRLQDPKYIENLASLINRFSQTNTAVTTSTAAMDLNAGRQLHDKNNPLSDEDPQSVKLLLTLVKMLSGKKNYEECRCGIRHKNYVESSTADIERQNEEIENDSSNRNLKISEVDENVQTKSPKIHEYKIIEDDVIRDKNSAAVLIPINALMNLTDAVERLNNFLKDHEKVFNKKQKDVKKYPAKKNYDDDDDDDDEDDDEDDDKEVQIPARRRHHFYYPRRQISGGQIKSNQLYIFNHKGGGQDPTGFYR